MRLKIIFILALFILQSAALFASDDSELWVSANNAYDTGNYESAIEGYRSVLEKGNRAPVVYYNLGNAYFKQNKIGLAIAAYRHCLKLEPSFAQARENLDYVRQYAIDKVEEKPKGFLLNIWYGLGGIFSSEGHFIFTLAVFWGLIAIISLLILKLGKQEILTYLLILLAIVFIIWLTVTYSIVNKEISTRWGVVTATSAELREGPGEDFEKIFTGHEGLEFKIRSQRQDYYLIELKNGLKGWIQATLLAEI